MAFSPPDEFYNPPGTDKGPPIDYTGTYAGDPDRILRQAENVDNTGAANQPPQPGNAYDIQAKALGNPSGQIGPGWTAPLPDDATPQPKQPAPPGSAAVPGGRGPDALAMGEGWYVDSQGRFVSDNMGANARANTTFDRNPSIGAGTILDNGKPGNVAPQQTYGEMQAAGRNPNLSGYGLTGDNTYGAPGGQQAAGGGYAQQGGNNLAYNPQLGNTVAQSYGGGPRPGTAGHESLLNGGPGELDAAHRIIRDENGHIVGVRDPDGYAPLDLKYHSIDEILLNAQELHPEAINLAQALADANVGQLSLEAKAILGSIPPEYKASQMYADAATAHNKIARANGENPATNYWGVPTSPQANDSVFTGQAELAKLLEQSGRTVINPLDQAGNVIFMGKDGVPRQITVAGPMVQNEIAKLRAEIASTSTQDASAPGGNGYNPRGGGYGGPRGGYGPPAGPPAAPPDPNGPGSQGVLSPRTEGMYRPGSALENDYQQSPSYDNSNLQQAGRTVGAYSYGFQGPDKYGTGYGGPGTNPFY